MVKYQLLLFLYFILFSICQVHGQEWSMDDANRDKWNNLAIDRINSMLNRKLNGNIAKNIILFLGDGMGESFFNLKTHF